MITYGCLFTATVFRDPLEELNLAAVPPINSGKTSRKTSGKTSGKIVGLMRGTPAISIPELAGIIGVTERSIERNIQKLQRNGIIRRIGPAKGGYWEVME